jgi:mannosyltransferase
VTPPLVIHPHLHPRRTGVTGHVEAVVPALASSFEVKTVGRSLAPSLPRIGWGELWRRIRTRPVVWHAHRNLELLAGLLLRPFARAMKIVFTRHSGSTPGAYTRLLARRAERVLTLTPEGARLIRAPAVVVGHGVDLSRYQPPADRRAAFRSLGVPGERALGIVGRVRPEKGHGDLAEAMAPLLARFPEWQIVLVGRVAPSHRAFAAELAHALGERVTFAGEQAEIARWYQGLDVLVHPSWSEGYSLVLLEALASGCCVIASRLPYTDGLVEHGRNGFLYEPRDVAGLRAILQEVLSDRARLEGVGRAAAADARARLGIDSEARALGEVYRGLFTDGDGAP